MKYRALGETELDVSEVGFGVWTVSTNWWRKITGDQGVNLLVKAFDLGVNFFDTADIYGIGYGEEILPKALKNQRHELIIGTKFGYDFYAGPTIEGHKERPRNYTPEFIRYACEQSLRRLDTDYIDLYQLHDPGMDAIEKDEVFDTLNELVYEGKIRYHGVSLGTDIGLVEEGGTSMRERSVSVLQIIYSILEQDPARRLFPIAQEEQTGLVTRMPHASGLLDGTYTKYTTIDSNDHCSHGRQKWLGQGLEKLARLEFLTENLDSTIGQIAIKFALSGPNVASVLPNITNLDQLDEFTGTSEVEDIPQDLLDHIVELYDNKFHLDMADET